MGYVNNKILRYEGAKMGLGFDPKKQPPSDKRGWWIVAKILEAIARQIKWWGE